MDIFRATKTKIVSTSGWARVHAPARIQSLWRIVPSSAADHLGRATLRPFGISHIAAHKACREPIRYPLRSIARQIVDTVGALTDRRIVDRSKSSRVWTFCGFTENGVCRSGLFIAPRIIATVFSARGLLPFGLRGQTLARPPAVGVGVVPIHTHDRQCTGTFQM